MLETSACHLLAYTLGQIFIVALHTMLNGDLQLTNAIVVLENTMTQGAVIAVTLAVSSAMVLM